MRRKISLLLLMAAIILSPVGVFAAVHVSPSHLYMKVYKTYLSKNADCSDPVLVVDNSSEPGGYKEVDFASNPSIGGGNIDTGTYNCVIVEISDLFRVTPNDTDDMGMCVKDKEFVLDICITETAAGHIKKTYDPINKTLTECTAESDVCGTPGEDRVWIYMSTNSAVTDWDNADLQPYQPPETAGDTIKGVKLNNAGIVSTDTIGTFVTNFNDHLRTIPYGMGCTRCSFDGAVFDFTMSATE